MAKPNTPREWLDWYEARRGEEVAPLPDSEFLFAPEHGFVTYRCCDDWLEVGFMGTDDAKFWIEKLITIMKLKGLSKLRFFTRRNPEAWRRKYGCRVYETGYFMEVGVEELEDRL